MAFKMPPIVVVLGLVCAGVGFIFQIVGVTTASWLTSDNVDAGSGLWKSCRGSVCTPLTEQPDWLEVSRGFGILGVLFLAGCVLLGVLMVLMENDKLPLAAAALGCVAGVCILIEFTVYVGKGEAPDGTSLNYSFALTVIAFVLSIVAGLSIFVGTQKRAP